MGLAMIVVFFQLILDFKLLGVSNDILSTIVVLAMPVLVIGGTFLNERFKLTIIDRRKQRHRKRKEKTYYTFVESKEEFKKSTYWPMIDDKGRIVQ